MAPIYFYLSFVFTKEVHVGLWAGGGGCMDGAFRPDWNMGPGLSNFLSILPTFGAPVVLCDCLWPEIPPVYFLLSNWVDTSFKPSCLVSYIGAVDSSHFSWSFKH